MGWGQLEIQLLGELRVLHDGEAIELPPSKRTRALLGYLVATQRAHTRQRMCDLFWEGPDDPRAALRWSLWKLRPLVDSGRTQRIVANRERIGFEAHGAAVDVVALRASLQGSPASADVASLEAAAKRFRGELLDGIELHECYAFQEWCAGERETYRALRLDILAALTTRLAREPERALVFARQRAALDPLSEDAHVQLVALLTRLGRHADAMKQYDACKRILEKELHRKPSPALVHARAAIHAAAEVTHGEEPSPPSPPAVVARPLVGRGEEERALDAIVAATRSGQPSDVVFFLGDPGIGKSRMLEALHERVRAAGGTALVARAFETERTRPYGPFVDAFREVALADVPPAIAGEVAHLLRSAPQALEGTSDKNRLFEAMKQLVEWLATRAPLCLSIDDLQWLDEASVALLHYCVRQARGAVVVAVAARTGELGDNPSALRLVRELARARRLRQVVLGPLGRDAIGALVSSIAEGIDVERVFDQSEGHPLYALELARAGDSEAASLDELIADRLVHLDDRAHDLLPWMAAMGRTVQPDLLAEATQLPVGHVVGALADLERRAVVRVVEDRYDFVHDLVRLAAYRRIAAPQRRLIHARIATVLAAREATGAAWAVDVARHADQGGDSSLCVAACFRACEQCLQVFAYDETEAFAELARGHTQRLPDAERIKAQMQLFTYLVHPGLMLRRPEALGSQIADLCAEAMDAGLNGECSLGFKLIAMLYRHVSRDMPRARAALTRAVEVLEKVPQEPNLEPLIEGARCLAVLEVDMPRARSLFDDLGRIRGVEGSLGYQWGVGLVHLWDGRLDDARAALRAANTLAVRAKKHWAQFETLAALAIVELEAKEWAEVLALRPELDRMADRLGEGGSEGPLAHALSALARLDRGDEGAVQDVDDAVRGLVRADSRYHLAYVQNAAATIDLRAGRLADARRRAESAKRDAEAVERIGEARRAEMILAVIDAHEGRPEKARALLRAARRDDFRSLPQRSRDILSLLTERDSA